MTEKQCTSCKESKHLFDFYEKKETKKDGTPCYRSLCKDCYNEKGLVKYHKNNGKEKQKARSFRALLKSYGISEEIYEQERQNQDYRCKICRAHEDTQFHRRLVVDHCHTTGLYRGLLCTKCNTGLGSFNDNISVLKNAIEYVNENRARHREQLGRKDDLAVRN